MTISYHLYFLRILKACSMIHHGAARQDQGEECYFMFIYNFSHFLVVFHQKFVFLYYFCFFFWWSIKSPQQNINRSETGTGDKKLSVELHVTMTTNLQTTKKIFITLKARHNLHSVEPTTLNLIIKAKTLITEQ